MRRSLTHFRIPTTPQKHSLRRCSLHLSATLSNAPALSLPALDLEDAGRRDRYNAESYISREAIRERKLNWLNNILAQSDTDDAVVWSRYVDFGSALDYDSLPLEVHQKVLRKCVPHPSVLRPISARRMQNSAPPRPPHMYEARLKTVMRNIRSAGHKPALDDYNYILEQFAAVGHSYGSMSVYNELKHVYKVQPTLRTFGLCLQSIVHRLSLPMYKNRREKIELDCASSCTKLLNDMSNLRIPITSVILDLVMRISKKTTNEAAFNQLMKLGYGIDLDYPDHPPIQWDQGAVAEVGMPQLPCLQPFSTAALNTTVDMLGRFGNVSKLVQAFEVLTQPLPPQASQHYSMEFDDEDEFGEVNPASTQPHRTPHAKPNSTTYNLLLKHLSRANHSTLARHYLYEAYKLDREADRTVRTQLYHTPYKTPAPQIAVNKGMLLSVFGAANRNKDMQLMRFVGYIARQAYRRKQNDIAYYMRLQRLQRQGQQPLAPDHDGSRLVFARSQETVVDVDPSSSSSPTEADAALDTAVTYSFAPPPVKCFDVSLHLAILNKDLEEIATFYTHDVLPALVRKTQRVKEKIGRRVWKQKDLYLLSEGSRSIVSRPEWVQMVNFGKDTARVESESEYDIDGRKITRRGRRRVKGQSGRVAGSRGLATSAAGDCAPVKPLVPPVGFFDPSFHGS
ncbi:hypothetical protein HYDPIDRAFT_23414 [Hydnomerulius pinastri MD-312]|nr:hypothetical protein HYDPIDRAFT_23414 [Hydnomerulius pinastri MD-312]